MKILKETRFIPSLGREANLYIGLPNSYETSTKRYPVLYMHDGHNLFYPEDSYSGAIWDVAGCFENHPELKEVIIVALSCSNLDNGRGRFAEYSEIDGRFRTLSDPANTAIMGSSMGGVISNAAALRYPTVFGRIASLSGAYYVALDEISRLNQQADFSKIIRYYMDTGDCEEGLGSKSDYLDSHAAIFEILKTKISSDRLIARVIPGGIHHESSWKARLAEVITILFE